MKVVTAPPELLADPESLAMMQAFYSRSKRGIEDRLAETTLDTEAIKAKLKSFYVGYGHDSIGQCGFTTFFLEDVSILAAKAIQHNALYNGQESSTRYIDFKASGAYKNVPHQLKNNIDEWLDVYAIVSNKVYNGLIEKYGPTMPSRITEGSDDYDPLFLKACKAKAFDIAGAFLPCGVLTNLSWTTSLATVNRELKRLFAHPLFEVRELAAAIQEQVRIHYPSVYQEGLRDCEEVEYNRVHGLANYDQYLPPHTTPVPMTSVITAPTTLWTGPTLPERPKYARLPPVLHDAAHFYADVTMDYRSFRDVQRHRTLHVGSPIIKGFDNFRAQSLTDVFEPWYIEALDFLGALKTDNDRLLLTRIENLITAVDRSPVFEHERQYAYPMGMKVRFRMHGSLGDWLYFCELRSGETVHATVRKFATRTWEQIEDSLFDSKYSWLSTLVAANIKTDNLDLENSLRPSFKRAKQDIVEKSAT